MLIGFPTLAAVFLLFITAGAIKMNGIVTKVFLKPHRELSEAVPIINLILLISGVMLAAFTIYIFLMSQP